MKKRTKAVLEILIHEVQGCKTLEEVNQLLKTWIDANDLHPEEVLTAETREELDNFLKQFENGP